MDLTRRLLPADAVVAAYNGVLACFWISATGHSPIAIAAALAHAALVALPAFIRRLPERSGRLVSLLREGYPLLALGPLWSDIGLLQRIRHAATHDALVQRLDGTLFGGVHLHAVWRPAMPAPWLSESMHAVYFGYYLLIAFPPLAFAIARNRTAFRDASFRMMTTYLACFAWYACFPVLGPRAHDVLAGILPTSGGDGCFAALVHRVLAAGDSPGTAFPSSHVAGSVTIAWIAARWFPRPMGWICASLAAAVAVATVYTQNHYAIDAVGGIAFGLVTQAWIAPRVERWVTGRAEPARELGTLPEYGA